MKSSIFVLLSVSVRIEREKADVVGPVEKLHVETYYILLCCALTCIHIARRYRMAGKPDNPGNGPPDHPGKGPPDGVPPGPPDGVPPGPPNPPEPPPRKVG